MDITSGDLDLIKSGLVNLSFTNLIQCLEIIDKKKQYISENKQEYSHIQKIMREESTVIQLRDFHNWIKLELIMGLTKQVKKYHAYKVSLLDISVGRGGDLAKWNKAGISTVYGFDKSDESINSTDPENPGARERLRQFKGNNVNIEYSTGDATNPVSIESKIGKFMGSKKFDLVSCQFALHYFFVSEVALNNVLYLVSKNLRSGGYFFGTVVDGDKVRDYISETSSGVFTRPLYRIESFFPNKRIRNPFGNKYTFKIFDNKSSNNYFNTMPASTEYLVNFETLKSVASKYSLEPVNTNFFETYLTDGKKEYSKNTSEIMSFEEIFRLGRWAPRDTTKNITPEQLELSFLNSTFVFRKK